MAAELIGDVVLPFLVIELVERYGIVLRQGLYRVAGSLLDLPQDHGRGNRFAELAAHETDRSAAECKLADVPIEAKTIKAPLGV